MPITIIVGGQYGSEGKGKVSAELAVEQKASFVIRSGGTNAGHTVIRNERKLIYRQLPTSHGYIPSVLVAGSFIDEKILLSEVGNGSLFVDPMAVLISDGHKYLESIIKKSIGSTGSGTGAALAQRTERSPYLKFAKDSIKLKDYLIDTKPMLRKALEKGERLIIEGSQGFGLSNIHSDCYPYTTSKDTTAASILGEVGLSPLDVDRIVLVLRAYPIRVAGNSGPLLYETSWEELGVPNEYTSVSKKIRRVGEFDSKVVLEAISANNPTDIVLNFVDYFQNQEEGMLHIEKLLGRRVDYIGASAQSITKRTK